MSSFHGPYPHPPFRPAPVTHFEREHMVLTNGVYADIRHFGWKQRNNGVLRADSHYIDYSFGPRPAGVRLLHERGHYAPPPGDVIFLPQGSVFDVECPPCDLRLLFLTFDSDRTSDLLGEDCFPALAPCFDVRSEPVHALLAQIVREVRDPGFAHDILFESLSFSLLVELCRYARNDALRNDIPRGRLADWRLRRIKDRIVDGVGGPLSIVDLAKEVGMSPRHLIRTFRNTVGMTLGDYIAEARIGRARQRLAEDGALVSAVARECGFSSATSFATAFRRVTGMTPKAYRDQRLR